MREVALRRVLRENKPPPWKLGFFELGNESAALLAVLKRRRKKRGAVYALINAGRPVIKAWSTYGKKEEIGKKNEQVTTRLHLPIHVE